MKKDGKQVLHENFSHVGEPIVKEICVWTLFPTSLSFAAQTAKIFFSFSSFSRTAGSLKTHTTALSIFLSVCVCHHSVVLLRRRTRRGGTPAFISSLGMFFSSATIWQGVFCLFWHRFGFFPASFFLNGSHPHYPCLIIMCLCLFMSSIIMSETTPGKVLIIILIIPI